MEPPFPSLKWGAIRVFALVFHSEWPPLLRWPGACADFPAKSRYDVIRASSGKVPMMWGFWMMIFMSQLCQDLGGIKGWMQGGRGSQFRDFRCRAYRVKLIPSRVLQCASTSGQPGILYCLTTKVCLIYWLLVIGVFLQSNLSFYWLQLFEWPSSQWA